MNNFLKDIALNLGIVGMFGLGGLVILGMIVLFPLAIIWALNTLFALGLPYTFKVWLAVFILSMAIGKNSPSVKKKD